MALRLIYLSKLFLRFSFSCEVSLVGNLFFRFNAIIVAFGNGLDHLIISNCLDNRFLSYDNVKGGGLFLSFFLSVIQT